MSSNAASINSSSSSTAEINDREYYCIRGLQVGGVVASWYYFQPSSFLNAIGTVAAGILGSAFAYAFGKTSYEKSDKENHAIRALQVGGAALSWHYFQPSGVIGVVGTIAGGFFGSTLAYVIGKTCYSRHQKTAHKVATRLDLRKELPNYDEAVKEAVERIQKHVAYPVLVAQEVTDDAHALDYFKSELTRGTCNGEAIALLKVSANLPDASCAQLLEATNKKDILYYQMLHIAEGAVEAKINKCLFTISLVSALKPSESKGEGLGLTESRINGLSTAYTTIKAELYPRSTTQGVFFSAGNTATEYQKQLTNLCKLKSITTVSSGRVILKLQEERKVANMTMITGHTLFFQCFPNCFRFYDSINQSQGFFEYSNEKEFYQSLRSQILLELGSKVQVRFAI